MEKLINPNCLKIGDVIRLRKEYIDMVNKIGLPNKYLSRDKRTIKKINDKNPPIIVIFEEKNADWLTENGISYGFRNYIKICKYEREIKICQ